MEKLKLRTAIRRFGKTIAGLCVARDRTEDTIQPQTACSIQPPRGESAEQEVADIALMEGMCRNIVTLRYDSVTMLRRFMRRCSKGSSLNSEKVER